MTGSGALTPSAGSRLDTTDEVMSDVFVINHHYYFVQDSN